MGIWNEGGFFSSVKGHVVKWWQSVITSVYQINNNFFRRNTGANNADVTNTATPYQGQQVQDVAQETAQKAVQETVQNISPSAVTEKTSGQDDRSEIAKQRAAQIQRDREKQLQSMISEAGKGKSTPAGTTPTPAATSTQDPMEILNRINREKNYMNSDEIEKARLKAQEQERIASIMNANKVDVNKFIAEGKAHRQAEQKQSAAMDEEAQQKQDEMKRAQEIIDRLNREAAEDEAKKNNEIEEAKRKAKEKFD